MILNNFINVYSFKTYSIYYYGTIHWVIVTKHQNCSNNFFTKLLFSFSTEVDGKKLIF